MSEIELRVKNMVCNRCVKVIRDELTQNDIKVIDIELGKVKIDSNDADDLELIKKILTENGFELLEDKKARIVEAVKTHLIELIYQDMLEDFDEKISTYLQKKMGMDYTSISSLFSTVKGVSIEKYFISQKIEKVKELIMYEELNIDQIAYKLGYSSVQHLSAQFKKVTGLSPKHYQKLKDSKRDPIDSI